MTKKYKPCASGMRRRRRTNRCYTPKYKSSGRGKYRVKGYTRADGVHVKGHTRRRPK